MSKSTYIGLTWLVVALLASTGDAQFGRMRKPADLIHKQEPVKINQSLLKQATPDNTHIVVSLPKQRAYLMVGDKIVVDEPISSGKKGHTTPSGHHRVLQKDPDHRSSVYGDFVDSRGRVVRAGV